MSAELESLSDKQQYDRMYGPESWVDVTDRIEVYEKGKAFECDCGQDIGVTLETVSVKCAGCSLPCIDLEADDREPPEREEGQQTLFDF